MSVDPESVSTIIKECAECYILPRYQKLKDHEVSSKTSPRDLVTQADLDVEEHLIRTLPGLLPGSIVIGEEGASKNPRILEQLLDNDLKIWIVDPVDGTHNFVHGKREFGVMLAFIQNGETRQSWIYDVLGEAMTVAEKGSGAYTGKEKLQVKAKNSIREMSGHVNPGFFPKEYRPRIKEAAKNFADCRSMACAAHEYLRVAQGDAQFSVYSRLKPWDHVAGTLIVEEAGGYCATWNGVSYTPKAHDVGLIVSADRKNWEMVKTAFMGDDV